MTNLIFISIAFPPKRDPECLQTARYFKYLSRSDHLNIEVVTSKIPTLFMPEDPGLYQLDKGYVNKIELTINENRYSNFILRKIVPWGVDFPDSKFSFHWKWRTVVNKLKYIPDVIYSRSYPLSSAIMAYKLHKHYRIPWVMHLSDPWVDSPIHNYSKTELRYQKFWEDKCFTNASKITFTSPATLKFYVDKFPNFESKFHYFPNVYDACDSGPNDINFNGKLRIVYTGGLAGSRNPAAFFKALSALDRLVPNLNDKIEVIFAGAIDRANKAFFRDCKHPFLRHVGELPFEKAKEMQQEAHILLLIESSSVDEGKNMFFPSKLLDYFLTCRKVLAITSRSSFVNTVVRANQGNAFEHDNTEALVSFLQKALHAFQNQDAIFFEASLPPETFEASYQARRLENHLLTL